MTSSSRPPGFYERPGLNTEVSHLRWERDIAGTGVEGDVAFLVAEAKRRGGPVLELGVGGGRVALVIAEAGFGITGLDRSRPMLAVAEARRAALPEPARSLVRLVHGDMAEFELGAKFRLVYSAFRSFQNLLTPEAQRSCLACVHRHLVPGGTLVLDLFDPRIEFLTPGSGPPPMPERGSVKHPRTGNEVRVRVLHRTNDATSQTFSETWRHEEVDASGRVVRSEDEVLTMRWTWRQEMRWLLELSGFEIEALYSDFRKSPPAYGNEQVWVARRSRDSS